MMQIRAKPYNDQMDESKANLRAVSANHLSNYCTQDCRAVILGDRWLSYSQSDKVSESCVPF